MKNLLFLCCLLSLITSCAFSNCKQMGQLQIGMSETQAIKIMDREPYKFSANGNTKYFYYSCRGSIPDSGIKFVGGNLAAYGPEENLLKAISWFKFSVTETEFKRDISECTERSTGRFGTAFNTCMEARGYKQVD
jgi:hypothetical protein